jgi:hypothetical protein
MNFGRSPDFASPSHGVCSSAPFGSGFRAADLNIIRAVLSADTNAFEDGVTLEHFSQLAMKAGVSQEEQRRFRQYVGNRDHLKTMARVRAHGVAVVDGFVVNKD